MEIIKFYQCFLYVIVISCVCGFPNQFRLKCSIDNEPQSITPPNTHSNATPTKRPIVNYLYSHTNAMNNQSFGSTDQFGISSHFDLYNKENVSFDESLTDEFRVYGDGIADCIDRLTEYFNPCGSGCDRTCSIQSRNRCLVNGCVRGCYCLPGFARFNGICIPQTSCPSENCYNNFINIPQISFSIYLIC